MNLLCLFILFVFSALTSSENEVEIDVSGNPKDDLQKRLFQAAEMGNYLEVENSLLSGANPSMTLCLNLNTIFMLTCNPRWKKSQRLDSLNVCIR